MELAAAMASAVTTAAMHHQLTYKEAAAAVSRVALQQRDAAASGVVVPVADVLAVLPHETVKPVARWYQLIKGFFGVIGPYYHAFMHYAEIPLVVGRRLTVPLMHQGSYRRRLIVVTAPFSFSFFVVIFSTHILKGIPTQIGGFPYWVMAFLAGLCYSAALHFYLLPQKSNTAKRDDETGTRQALLHGAADAHADAPVDQSGSAGGSGHDGASNDHGASAHGHGKHRPWYKKLGILIAGPNDQPVPTGIMMWLLLTMSFVMSLFWLLLIATEIVGVAICFGKVLNIPDIVMGLTVLAVGCVWGFGVGLAAAVGLRSEMLLPRAVTRSMTSLRRSRLHARVTRVWRSLALTRDPCSMCWQVRCEGGGFAQGLRRAQRHRSPT